MALCLGYYFKWVFKTLRAEIPGNVGPCLFPSIFLMNFMDFSALQFKAACSSYLNIKLIYNKLI